MRSHALPRNRGEWSQKGARTTSLLLTHSAHRARHVAILQKEARCKDDRRSGAHPKAHQKEAHRKDDRQSGAPPKAHQKEVLLPKEARQSPCVLSAGPPPNLSGHVFTWTCRVVQGSFYPHSTDLDCVILTVNCVPILFHLAISLYLYKLSH